jgi:hypothetical protein|tara:strand:- start:134 stop:286 length:153 start_codon:yes stop_codon:yes gene_type:complete
METEMKNPQSPTPSIGMAKAGTLALPPLKPSFLRRLWRERRARRYAGARL